MFVCVVILTRRILLFFPYLEQERMPYAEGFPQKPAGKITAQEILGIVSKLTAA